VAHEIGSRREDEVRSEHALVARQLGRPPHAHLLATDLDRLDIGAGPVSIMAPEPFDDAVPALDVVRAVDRDDELRRSRRQHGCERDAHATFEELEEPLETDTQHRLELGVERIRLESRPEGLQGAPHARVMHDATRKRLSETPPEIVEIAGRKPDERAAREVLLRLEPLLLRSDRDS